MFILRFSVIFCTYEHIRKLCFYIYFLFENVKQIELSVYIYIYITIEQYTAAAAAVAAAACRPAQSAAPRPAGLARRDSDWAGRGAAA